jgi:EAL and modified HD-GYP domain-containing signal transduction protein
MISIRDAASMDAYVARQPIFNQRKKIFGYELLFRDGTAKYVPGIDGDVATSTVLSNTFFVIGMDNLLGGNRSFINFTQNLIIRKIPLLLPKQTTVVEILESVQPTPDLIEACQEISRKGYTIALDDFTYAPELDPLIAIADIIKFDFRMSSTEKIQQYLKSIPQRKGLSLLAEKVETHNEFKSALKMGFELFQGYFFSKPELVKGKELPASQLALLQIVAEVNKRDFDFSKLESLISPDVSLSYKLLRYINSAFFATAQKISSIKQALVYLGEAEIRRFVSLISLSNLGMGKPPELIRMACIRAKFCELLAEINSPPAPASELFTLGIFSLIDAIVDQPMAQVMDNLPLSDNIKDALVHRKGNLIGYLLLVETYEKGQWEFMTRVCQVLDIPEANLPELYAQACRWSNMLTESE